MVGSVSQWPIGVEVSWAGPEAGEGGRGAAAAAGSLNDAVLDGGERRAAGGVRR